MGPSVTLIGLVVVLNPVRLSESVCSPMLALSTHGVTHAVPGKPSSVTVAPAGWVCIGTSTEVAIRVGRGASTTGGGLALTTGVSGTSAGSDFAGDSDLTGASDFTRASGSLTGS